MTAILNYDRARPELIELGVLDESANYEVDITEIHFDPQTKEFVLLTATGCSCWSGEYDEERFKTPKELITSLLKDERTYNPSFEGARLLVRQARRRYKDLKAQGRLKI